MVKPTGLLLTTLTVCLSLVAAYPSFQKRIPNGNRVPNPCQPNTIWQGVGHKNPAGAGERNPFGLDFAANDFSWKAVCELDSDGDGQTNGQELGDPTCEWKQGDAQPSNSVVSHPGVCEPLYSPECIARNSWLECPSKFNCPAIKEPGVEKLSLRLPPTKVPPKETTYMCHAMALPQDDDYHVIATTPILINPDLIHHILIYMCDTFNENDDAFTGSKECFMSNAGCTSLIGLWGVGSDGQCLLDSYGFHIGKNGFKYAYMEVHWNNPLLVDGLVDSSGLTVYYTRNRRPSDGLVLMAGQLRLELPPGLRSVTFQSTCREHCTSQLSQPIYITWATVHMHLQGRAGSIELFRGGRRYGVLINETNFDYNTPPQSDFEEPFEVLPGDEIRVTCEYSTLNRNATIYYGEGTNEEMCYAFITYFPADQQFTFCNNYRTADVCSNNGLDCDHQKFSELAKATETQCRAFPLCTKRCKAILEGIKGTKCLEGDNGRLFDDWFPTIKNLRNLMEHCAP